MSYQLTEEQQMLKDTVARIAKEQIAPGAALRDEEAKFPWDMVEILRENALFGADFPEEYGGSEMGYFSLPGYRGDRKSLCIHLGSSPRP